MDEFVHLHVHSHYSLLDGAIRLKELTEAAASQGMKAIALTDHGNLFGAIEFYTAARHAGIKPILGMEAYISPTTRHDRSMGNIQTAAYHLILLAMNKTGWRNLIKLSTRAYLEGFYYRPRIDREILSELGEGLICTTACLGGEVSAALLADKPKRARRIASEYLDIFGRERFFIELQEHNLPEQKQLNPQLIALAEELGVTLVATNDVHFLRREDKPAHEILTCISTGKTLTEGGALEYSPEVYLKSPAEMAAALERLPAAAAANTLKIAEMCHLKLNFSTKHLPKFKTPAGKSDDEYLSQLATEGLRRRFGGEPPGEYAERLNHELNVIADKGYSSYFLIVNDFVQFARRNGIPASPRGSGVATLLGYALELQEIDPVRYGLLFERFTDPQREEDPDMDIDICQEGRARVIDYVRQRYGNVAQIITYGTLKARAVVRDVGRVMALPLRQVDDICKKVPEGLGVNLRGALQTEPDLREMYEQDEQVHQLIEYGVKLEGLARHAGVHAAGVIVATEPLENLVPLCRQADGDELITQWDGETCAFKVGLMKMDFLGLRTLTIIQRARELVRQRTGKDIDPEKLPLGDQEVLELFRQGQTDGVFQFESAGMKSILMQMEPNRIEDLIAANAMYRPGPMELIPTYIARKHGREPVPSLHPLVDDILSETYGIMCYQEQVMQVLSRLGKLPLSRALTLIKAISKKKRRVIAAERPHFIEGARENGISADEAGRLFDRILKFGGYGFNKAHSARYAIVAYQTAYFKAHYPREFLAATLTFEGGDTDKVVQYMAEAQRMGVSVAPPDINTCNRDFTVDGEQVRFGLAAVKGVGAKAVEAIVEARKEVGRFENLYHFCEQADLHAVNKSVVEALIKCGAFDALGAHRGAMMAALDGAVELGQTAAADRRSGQMGLFAEDDRPAPRFPKVEPWSEAQLLAAEKETLGFFVSSHPLVRYGRELTSLSSPQGVSLANLGEWADQTPVTVGCMIASVRRTVTRTRQQRMAVMTVEDLTGKAGAVVFPRAYEKLGGLLEPEKIVFLLGNIDRSRQRPQIIVEEVIAMDEAIGRLTAAVLVRLPAAADHTEQLSRLRAIIADHSGNCPTYIELTPSTRADVRTTIRAEKRWSIQPSRELAEQLSEAFGQENVAFYPRRINGNNNRRHRFAQRRPPRQGLLLKARRGEAPPVAQHAP
ncbi:MAG: DNA polymerase III subunit alpha [Planctomycetota bacterium]|jgi:DNA polymerase-3 subunit alpha